MSSTPVLFLRFVSLRRARPLRAAATALSVAALCFTVVGLSLEVRAASPVAASKPATVVPLHERIDRLLEAERLAPLGPMADDAEFLRRVTLDLHGIIPSADEAQAFLADTAADKRAKLIDGLLASPRFVRHFATTFDVMWGERLGEKAIKSSEWYEYLYTSFAERKPYDVLVREILTADDVDPKLKPASKFFHDRECEPNTMTRDIGRMFFGMDMQCNQCHDHPVIDDYRIGDYYGLYAFVNRTYLAGARKGAKTIAEKADGEANFKSVFTGEAADKTAPRIPRGVVLAAEPTFAKGEEFVKKPAKDEIGIPKYSRRRALAAAATAGDNDLFDRNGANRLWALVFGRGLVHPVDFIHPDNPPTHPAVLDLVTAEFRARKYDVRDLVGELVRTRAYQRSFLLPQPSDLQPGIAAKQGARWTAELKKLEPALAAARAASEKANDVLGAARGKGKKPAAAATTVVGKTEPGKSEAAKPGDKDKAAAPPAPKVDLVALQSNYETAAAEYRKLRTLSKSLQAKLDEAEKIVAYEKVAKGDKAGALRAWEAVVQTWTDRGEVTLLKPLPPEVFAASLMQATGLVGVTETKVRASLKKAAPKELMAVAEAQRPRMEAMLCDKQTFDSLKSNYNRFIDLYGEAAGGGFAATLNQALFFGNGTTVDAWLKPSGDNLPMRLEKTSDAGALADLMYLAVYTRKPSADERSAVGSYLKGREKDRSLAVQEMLWALLSGSEFRFNH